MSSLYLAGSAFNLFGRGTVSSNISLATPSSVAYAYDKDPSTPVLWSSAATDTYLRVEANALTNPGFETSTLSGWTAGSTGTGTSAETTTAGEFRSGSKALELTGTDTSNYGSRYQDITVNAGEYRRSTFYMRAIGAGTGKLFLKNLKTGNYYNGQSSVWASSRVYAATYSSTAAFPGTQTVLTYQMESFDACRSDTVSLRWELACESGDVCFDDVADFPGVNFASIHGHNLGPITPLVQSADSSLVFSTQYTMTVKRPAFFYAHPTTIAYAENWQILLSGTTHEAAYIGEAVIGQYQTSATSPKWGIPRTRTFPGARARSQTGRSHIYNYCTDPPEDLGMSFSARTDTAAKELADSLWLRSGQGLNPTIIVPIDSEDRVYYGRLLDPHMEDRPFQGVYDTTSLVLMGDPFPTIGL
jgi:hypothetical protein